MRFSFAVPRSTAWQWLCCCALLLMGLALPLHARDSRHDSEALPVLLLQDLPRQAKDTYALILAGGPFPYEKDGTTFHNRERLLPQQKRGYYREYTVRTPRVRHRGARRIVCGGAVPSVPDRCYYTSDHYASFSLIAAPAAAARPD